MAKATRRETKIKIAREILGELSKAKEDGYIVFAELRAQWEKRCQGSFDTFLRELIFADQAWLKDSYRGQQRHGRGFDGILDKQIVKLYIF